MCLVCDVAFLGLNLADNFGGGDFPQATIWDMVVLDVEEDVGALYLLPIVGTSADALAEVTKLVCVGGVPDGGESGGEFGVGTTQGSCPSSHRRPMLSSVRQRL